MKDQRDVTLIKTCSCRKIVGTKHFLSLCPIASKAWSQIRTDPNLSPYDSARERPFIVIPRLDTKYHEDGLSITNCVRGPKDHPQFRGFSRRTHKMKHIFVVTAVIHDNERCEAVGKVHGIKSEKTRHKFLSPLQWNPTDGLIPRAQNWDHTCDVVSSGLHWGLVT